MAGNMRLMVGFAQGKTMLLLHHRKRRRHQALVEIAEDAGGDQTHPRPGLSSSWSAARRATPRRRQLKDVCLAASLARTPAANIAVISSRKNATTSLRRGRVASRIRASGRASPWPPSSGTTKPLAAGWPLGWRSAPRRRRWPCCGARPLGAIVGAAMR